MKENKKQSRLDQLKEGALYDVEHALGMYAVSYCSIPAEAIYEKEVLDPLMEVIDTCHIYLIGYAPVIDFTGASQSGSNLTLNFKIAEKEHEIVFQVPEEYTLKIDDDLHYLEDSEGQRSWFNENYIQSMLSDQSKAVTFEVKYVGQAYGKDGSRNAIDRLLKHETLQKISVKGVPSGYRLSLLMLAIQPSNQLLTVMNPFAKNKDEGNKRIRSGLDKLFNTDEQERITLYEASLIKYFSPEFNKEFKNSFPSTNLKVLQDCYEKDFGAVMAEICIDELPFQLFSEEVRPAFKHIAKHDLHKEADRKMFFGL